MTATYPISGRWLYVDLIRVCALLGVVTIHVSSPLVSGLSPIHNLNWWIGNLFDSFCRPAVPLFVMISGVLLLDLNKKETIYQFFNKRFKEVVIPFLLWATIYLFWIALINDQNISFFRFIREILQGPVYNHFWFIYMILGLYLVTPILREFTGFASRSIQIYFIVLWFLVSSLFPIIESFFHFKIGIYFMITTGFSGYFVLGHLLHDVPFSKRGFIFAIFLFSFSWMATVISSLMVSTPSGFNPVFYDYLSPNVVGMSIGSFLILKSIPYHFSQKDFPLAIKGIRYCSSISLNVYLMHIILLETFHYGSLSFTLDAYTFHPLVGILLTVLITCIVCSVVLFPATKLPLVKFFFGY